MNTTTTTTTDPHPFTQELLQAIHSGTEPQEVGRLAGRSQAVRAAVLALLAAEWRLGTLRSRLLDAEAKADRLAIELDAAVVAAAAEGLLQPPA